jgi:hypothetical protein
MFESCYDVVEMETHTEANRAVTAKANAPAVEDESKILSAQS